MTHKAKWFDGSKDMTNKHHQPNSIHDKKKTGTPRKNTKPKLPLTSMSIKEWSSLPPAVNRLVRFLFPLRDAPPSPLLVGLPRAFLRFRAVVLLSMYAFVKSRLAMVFAVCWKSCYLALFCLISVESPIWKSYNHKTTLSGLQRLKISVEMFSIILFATRTKHRFRFGFFVNEFTQWMTSVC